ncbi:MAG: helix-turn-helix domain-containing protein [Clostridium sp.]|nr:helix-turn-helix domain-containing protein [Clostridium sp.]
MTLKAYIRACYSKSGTSETLNIHRNTLAYRLEKISEITGANLRDPATALHLMISFYYLDR